MGKGVRLLLLRSLEKKSTTKGTRGNRSGIGYGTLYYITVLLRSCVILDLNRTGSRKKPAPVSLKVAAASISPLQLPPQSVCHVA